jgi:hypothetical protein
VIGLKYIRVRRAGQPTTLALDPPLHEMYCDCYFFSFRFAQCFRFSCTFNEATTHRELTQDHIRMLQQEVNCYAMDMPIR